MSGRFLSIHLPQWPIERLRLRARRLGEPFPGDDVPLALVRAEAGCPRITAANPAARADGITTGMNQADARAILPALRLLPAAIKEDGEGLRTLGEWAIRYSPRVALDGPADLMIDITGCAHLFGGEEGLLADLDRQLGERGITCRCAIADRQAEAWARARFRTDCPLAEWPVQTLRIDGAGCDLPPSRSSPGGRSPRPAAPLAAAALRPVPVMRTEALAGEQPETFTPCANARNSPRAWALPIPSAAARISRRRPSI
ncbi:MAG: DNA polymerase Y family protein [Geminicoccaceae bacterium]